VGVVAERMAHSNSQLKSPLAQLAVTIRRLADNLFVAREGDDERLAGAALHKDEVGDIAGAIQLLRERLRSYLEDLRRATAAREQVESELRIAGRIQTSFLPYPLEPDEAARVDFAAFPGPPARPEATSTTGFSSPTTGSFS